MRGTRKNSRALRHEEGFVAEFKVGRRTLEEDVKALKDALGTPPASLPLRAGQ